MERKERERDWKSEGLTNREREGGNRWPAVVSWRKKEGRRRKKNQGPNDTLGKTERKIPRCGGVFRRLEKRLYDVRSPSRGKIALYAPLALYVTARIRVNSKAREPVRFLFIGEEKREEERRKGEKRKMGREGGSVAR